MGITPLTIGRLLDFVLDDADARPIELAARGTPELRSLVLQARALLELAVEGQAGLGPGVRRRLQQVLAFGRPQPWEFEPMPRPALRGPRTLIREVDSGLAALRGTQQSPPPPRPEPEFASARLGPFEPGTAVTLTVGGIETTLRCAAEDAARWLVVDLSAAPIKFFSGGWALWLPDGGPPRRAHFGSDGLATFAWPAEPSGALRVDAAVAFVIELAIAT